MSKNKIYIEITPFFPTKESFRGPYIYDQVRALQQADRFSEVRVLRPASIFCKESHYEYNGVRVFYFPCLESPSYLLNGILDPINKWLFRQWWKSSGWKASDVEIVHAHVSTLAIYPLVMQEMNKAICTIVQHHDLDPYTIRNGRWADKKWNILFRATRNIKLFSKIDCHICVSEKVKESLLAFPQARKGEFYNSYLSKLEKLKNCTQKATIKRALVLYNGVDTKKFYPMPKERNSYFKIGCIANFVELKGHHVLLQAIRILIQERKMTDIRLSLIGSGPLLDSCKSYVKEQHLDSYVTFEPEVQHGELCTYYNSLDLFVLPSYFEGFGCVFTEAAACGVPFMTCKDQGVEDYLPEHERSQWLFTINDFLQLANLIEQYRSQQPSVEQKLSYSWDINKLIVNYLDKLGIE